MHWSTQEFHSLQNRENIDQQHDLTELKSFLRPIYLRVVVTVNEEIYDEKNPSIPFILQLIWEVFHLTTASGIPLSLIRERLNISTINCLIIFVSLLYTN